jgi:UDP-N-acetylmuramyl pentapeptide phosphotransferase/UDP-N-acetylglucosamine-1-phosphate transferase
MSTLLPALIAGIVAGITLVALRTSRGLPFDRPNARSLHRHAVPRGGGLAVWVGWFAGIVWIPGARPWLLPLAAVVMVSFFDDRHGIPVGLRLFIQLAAAATWLWLAGPLPDVLMAAVLVVAIVWMANLYNFMDGSDGLSGTMAIVGFSAYALAASWAGSERAPAFLALAAAVTPFLVANWPPARVFFGDVGAVPLGFLAAVSGIEGWQAGWWPAWFPLLVFLPFIADASSTLLRRLLRGERIWQAHRDHYYQRFVQLEFGHRGTLALYAAVMVGAAVSGLAALAHAPQTGWYLLLLWAGILTLLFASVTHRWRTKIGDFDESKR